MCIDEAIEHCNEVSQQCNKECSIEHIQLAKWLEELKELRKLFTLTAEDIKTVKLMAFLSFEHLDFRVQYNLNTKEECQVDVDRINKLLTRIKQQDENDTTTL